jgi:hypothetical protein
MTPDLDAFDPGRENASVECRTGARTERPALW